VRQKAGLSLLTLNLDESIGTGACVGSFGHSLAMEKSNRIWHTDPWYPKASFPQDICTPSARPGASENVGVVRTLDPTEGIKTIFEQQMSDPHTAAACRGEPSENHACHILGPEYHQVGLGIYFDGNAVWLTESFLR
jgi:uncharacterized protein YkwD